MIILSVMLITLSSYDLLYKLNYKSIIFLLIFLSHSFTMQSNTNSLVTAPKVFSNLNYYKSHHPFYAHQQQQQQSFKNKQYINTVSPLQSSIHSANNVTMATAVGVDFTDNSLPPLSHLLTANDSVPHSQCKKWQMPSLEHHNRLKDEVFMMHPLYSSTTQPELFPHTHSVRSHHLPSPPISVDNGMINNEGHQKTFSFVPIPGVQHKKRPRRKHHEVERLYKCNFQNCTKAYGTLNHLNAHVSMQKHVKN